MKSAAVLNERGYLTAVLIIAVVAAAVYVGIEVGRPYYRHAAFRSEAVELARISLGRPDKLMASLLKTAEEMNVPVTEENISIEKASNDRMHVSIEWTEELNILDLYRKTLEFSIDFTE